MSYFPTFPGEQVTPQWLYDELQRISTALEQPTSLVFDILTAAPTKPQEGMFVVADGVSWNPGAGGGPYAFFGGVWNKLY